MHTSFAVTENHDECSSKSSKHEEVKCHVEASSPVLQVPPELTSGARKKTPQSNTETCSDNLFEVQAENTDGIGAAVGQAIFISDTQNYQRSESYSDEDRSVREETDITRWDSDSLHMQREPSVFPGACDFLDQAIDRLPQREFRKIAHSLNQPVWELLGQNVGIIKETLKDLGKCEDPPYKLLEHLSIIPDMTIRRLLYILKEFGLENTVQLIESQRQIFYDQACRTRQGNQLGSNSECNGRQLQQPTQDPINNTHDKCNIYFEGIVQCPSPQPFRNIQDSDPNIFRDNALSFNERHFQNVCRYSNSSSSSGSAGTSQTNVKEVCESTNSYEETNVKQSKFNNAEI